MELSEKHQKIKIIGATTDGKWVHIYYKLKYGRKVYGCYVLENELKNDTLPVWFGNTIR